MFYIIHNEFSPVTRRTIYLNIAEPPHDFRAHDGFLDKKNEFHTTNIMVGNYTGNMTTTKTSIATKK